MTSTDTSSLPTAILLDVQDGIGVLTLNRPAVRNAIDDAMRTELLDALDRAARDPAIRALVVTGAGKAFCAGGDIKGMKARLDAPAGDVAFNGWTRQQRTHHALTALFKLPKPTIAAVNGAAAGLGCDMALSCDFVIAADNAPLSMTYIHRGLIPDGGGMYFLPRRVGLARAKELIFSGRRVAADEALAIGMIDRVAAPEALLVQARAWAAELSHGSAAALALAKTQLNQTYELSAEQSFAMSSQAQAMCYSTAEHRASVAAFLAKTASKG
ncbi:enoyl-CoA hydratase/isomerase family protein [Bordetella sp. BOR01]|uniref:enoyl-CoA hydratase/isomerase family protein n=1 Tax=Bordetella sp. BOR01 TaxID=2854779 RepID=UPI001C492CD7|nr:enoyl-CoA hydratase/isomerase family protein [Bordetella sp. BOR01]MBV7486614.1 enoyl-CoA hydratase/isomerase family protein [Bordetella sp. BOR01]